MIIKYKIKKGWHITPCPHGESTWGGLMKVGSILCMQCEHNRSIQFTSLKDDEIECGKEALE